MKLSEVGGDREVPTGNIYEPFNLDQDKSQNTSTENVKNNLSIFVPVLGPFKKVIQKAILFEGCFENRLFFLEEILLKVFQKLSTYADTTLWYHSLKSVE